MVQHRISEIYRTGLFGGLFSLAAILSTGATAQFPFRKGEKLTYELVYQWGFIWAEAGQATFTVGDTLVGSDRFYKFKGYGESYSHWDWFYKVSSTYASYADAKLNSMRFMRYGQEGSYRYNRDYHVKDEVVHYKKADNGESPTYTTLPKLHGALDVITAIYYCRTIDFSSKKPGTRVPLTFYLDGAYHNTFLEYVGPVTWENPRNGQRHACFLFKPSLIEGTIFKAGEHMSVYVSADSNRIPIYIETELRIGRARIFLL